MTLRTTGQGPKSSVWKAAKDQLKNESEGKCAYCEGKASHVAHGDVEHYRPKKVYWWLAYCYDNYVFACQVCNQSYKGSSFPIQGTPLLGPALPAGAGEPHLRTLAGTLAPDPLNPVEVQSFLAAAAAEIASIPDPYAVDPEPLFSWSADAVLREVELLPRDASPAAVAAHAAAERFLGLNRDELKRWRFEVYEIAQLLANVLKSGQLDPALAMRTEDQLRAMMSARGEFAGMVRYLVRDVEGLAL